MAVPMTPAGDSLRPGAPRMLFEGGFLTSSGPVPKTYGPDVTSTSDRGRITVVVGLDEVVRLKLR